jgi:queuine tRNA-ribosyltransferase
MRWARRSKTAFGEQPGHACFGIVQGGTLPGLRRESAEELRSIGFDGYAIGGLAVGEPQAEMFLALEATAQHLPTDAPRYLMGVGKPDDIAGAVLRGIDMFDCVLPTRSGRNGQVFTRSGTLNLRNAKYAEDQEPLDAECGCPACSRYTRAYLHHVVKSREIIASMLLTWHNLTYFQDIMARLRGAVQLGQVRVVADAIAKLYVRATEEP